MGGSRRGRLTELLFGFMPAQVVFVAARLRIPDHLVGGPMTVDELADAAAADPAAMRRFVRGMAGVGLVALDADGLVSLTEMGRLLASDAPGSMRDVALHFGGEGFTAWSRLDHAVQTGEPAFEAALGEPFFTYLEHHPEAGRAFDGTMTGMSHGVIAGAVEVYDFSDVARVLDIAGGRGHFVAAILGAHLHLAGALFDQPHVAAGANEYLAGTDVADRCEVIGGSFFEALPVGYDLHILKWILHDWNDESCAAILAASRRALPDDGRLLVVERVLPETVETGEALPAAVASDLNMLVDFGDAVERSLAEYETLLEAAGFAVHDVLPLPADFSILDCRPRG